MTGTVRERLARRLRFLADRIDPRGAPRAVGWSYTFEHPEGVVFREMTYVRGRPNGCPLWYLGEDDHELAWTESQTLPPCGAIHAHGPSCEPPYAGRSTPASGG